MSLDHSIDSKSLLWEIFCHPIRRDRNAFGGGIMIYIRNYLSFKRHIVLENSFDETIWLEIFLPHKSILLCTAYRPESNTVGFWSRLEDAIDNALDISPKIVLLGDFNEDLLSVKQNVLKDLLKRKYLQNVITEPTRVTNKSCTLLDPIIVSNDVDVFESCPFEFFPNISDDKGTFININLNFSPSLSYTRDIWCYKKGDYDKLNSLIKFTNWTCLFKDTPVGHPG